MIYLHNINDIPDKDHQEERPEVSKTKKRVKSVNQSKGTYRPLKNNLQSINFTL